MEKGQGIKTNNSITLDQRVKVFDWCKNHSTDTRSFTDMATSATADLGFTVTHHIMNNHWCAVNGQRFSKKKVGRPTNESKFASLEKRISKIEQELGITYNKESANA